jgi:predicted 3-demethylubiquinone-9 3-methyltransferase (glyoxalase superfamily)
MKSLTTFLMFEKGAADAAKFYVSLFDDAKITSESAFGNSITFEIQGQRLAAFDGGPDFKFTEGMSLMIMCDTQAEVDDLWSKLSANGGKPIQCGWVKDRYGVFWQVIPKILGQYLADHDKDKAERVRQAMFKMIKIESDELTAAYEGQ